MPKRRKFLSDFAVVTIGSSTLLSLKSCAASEPQKINKPVVISTWANIKANEAAWKVLAIGGNALDAVEEGAKIPESDPNDTSVGFGGMPDRDGDVTLDACIMDMNGNCGSVCFLKNIDHPISVARKVMEETPHVILAGEGALKFAISMGFKEKNMLSENAEKSWKEWKKTSQYSPVINSEKHDTIGILALDEAGNLSGACTTSGLAFKMKGRVGDSPIIGAGLFVDNEVGAAAATGMGEEVLKTLGSFLVVEFMRHGKSPEEACKLAVKRIVGKKQDVNFQVGFVALNKTGEVGGYSIQKGFEYAVHTRQKNEAIPADSLLK